MGTDIHTIAQKKINGVWVNLYFRPFDWRGYNVYGFPVNVRNYSGVPFLQENRGFPKDFIYDEDEIWLGDHSYGWLSLKELSDFNYDGTVEDRRVTKQIAPNAWSGGCTCEP